MSKIRNRFFLWLPFLFLTLVLSGLADAQVVKRKDVWKESPGKTYLNTGSNNVGIGTSAPAQKLDVNGTVKAVSYLGDGSQLTGIASATSAWSRSNGNIYPVTLTDNVGIGSSIPGAKLDIVGPDTTTGRALVIRDANAAAKVTVLDNGNVGVGTITPTAKVDILNSSAAVVPLKVRAVSGQTADLSDWYDEYNSLVALVRKDGVVFGREISTTDNATAAISQITAPIGFHLTRTGAISWSGSGSWFDTKDTGISRSAAGVLEINNATVGTFRDLKLRNLLTSGNVGVGSTAPVAPLQVSLPSGGYTYGTGGNSVYNYDAGGGHYYRVHIFTAIGSSTFYPPTGLSLDTFRVLVVGGGGTGAGWVGGGGGGGQVTDNASYTNNASSYNLSVGTGGQNTTFGTITAVKGGDGNQAGSGGTSGNGYAGGSGHSQDGGAGGGAGQAGSNYNGPGGNGVVSNITGVNTYYGGGGAGGVGGAGGSPSTGGLGGGANGGAANMPGNPGAPNTGGGSGGAGGGSWTTASGGSGIVIVSYPIPTFNYTGALTAVLGGRTGVNDANPDAMFGVKGGGADSTTASFEIKNSNALSLFKIFDSGAVGVGTLAPSAKLSVVGYGTTSSTLAVDVRNSAGSPTFSINDAGVVGVPGSVGIGTSSPPKLLSVGAGSQAVTGATPIVLVKGDLEVDGKIYGTSYVGSLLGAWSATLTGNTVYYASTDLFVVDIGTSLYVGVYSDASNPPSTTCAYAYNGGYWQSLACVVRKGEYYKTVNAGRAIPIGSP